MESGKSVRWMSHASQPEYKTIGPCNLRHELRPRTPDGMYNGGRMAQDAGRSGTPVHGSLSPARDTFRPGGLAGTWAVATVDCRGDAGCELLWA